MGIPDHKDVGLVAVPIIGVGGIDGIISLVGGILKNTGARINGQFRQKSHIRVKRTVRPVKAGSIMTAIIVIGIFALVEITIVIE